MDEFLNERKAVDVIHLGISKVLNTVFPCIPIKTSWSERMFKWVSKIFIK